MLLRDVTLWLHITQYVCSLSLSPPISLARSLPVLSLSLSLTHTHTCMHKVQPRKNMQSVNILSPLGSLNSAPLNIVSPWKGSEIVVLAVRESAPFRQSTAKSSHHPGIVLYIAARHFKLHNAYILTLYFRYPAWFWRTLWYCFLIFFGPAIRPIQEWP